MKAYTYIILITVLAALLTMVVLFLTCEESRGDVDIYEAYTDTHEKHLRWHKYERVRRMVGENEDAEGDVEREDNERENEGVQD